MPHTHPEKEKNREADALLKGIITGAIIGAGILWFIGTDTGKKLKQEIEDEGEDLIKRAKSKFDEATGTQSDLDEDDFSEPVPMPPPAVPLTPNTEIATKPTLKKATATTKKLVATGRRFFKRKA